MVLIPLVKQSSPNTVPRYVCEKCGIYLEEWNFCPCCGERIEWEKVRPVEWKELVCSACGSWIIGRLPSGFYYTSGDYIGTDVCLPCQTRICVNTNCEECKKGPRNNCEYSYLKAIAEIDGFPKEKANGKQKD